MLKVVKLFDPYYVYYVEVADYIDLGSLKLDSNFNMCKGAAASKKILSDY